MDQTRLRISSQIRIFGEAKIKYFNFGRKKERFGETNQSIE